MGVHDDHPQLCAPADGHQSTPDPRPRRKPVRYIQDTSLDDGDASEADPPTLTPPKPKQRRTKQYHASYIPELGSIRMTQYASWIVLNVLNMVTKHVDWFKAWFVELQRKAKQKVREFSIFDVVQLLTGVAARTISRVRMSAQATGELYHAKGESCGSGPKPSAVFEDPFFAKLVHEHLRVKNVDEGCGTSYKTCWRSLKPRIFDLWGVNIKYDTMRKALKRMFKVRKCKGDKKHTLRESTSTQMKRWEFVQKMREHVPDDRVPIVAFDEAAFHTNPPTTESLFAGKNKKIVRPSGAGQRVVILGCVQYVPANGATPRTCRWITESLFFLTDDGKLADYKCGKGTMTAEAFEDWQANMVPHCLHGSVVVFDNASVHSRFDDGWLPNRSQAKKAEIVDWLTPIVGADAVAGRLKPELYKMAVQHKPPPRYFVDTAFWEAGLIPCRTPPYHPELQLTEFIWAEMKKYVYARTDGTLTTLKRLIMEALDELTEERMLKYHDHCMKIWREWANHRYIDFIINLDSDSDTEDDEIGDAPDEGDI